MTLTDSKIKYRVLVNGKILKESDNRTIADVFVANLTEDLQKKAQIIPIIEDGRQLLFD